MQKHWLTRNLILITLVSLFQDAASELIYPLLPLLMASVAGAPALLLGVTEGLADFAVGLTQLWSGRKSDEWGRRGFITAGYGLAGVGKAVVAIGTIWPLLTLGRLLDRFGKGLRGAPRDALLADDIPKEDLGKAFGFHRAGDNLGAVFGPLIALAGLAATNNNVRQVALWAIGPAIISTLLTLAVKDSKARKPKSETALAPKVELSPAVKKMAIWLGVVAITNIPDALLLLRIHEIGVGATGVVLAYVLFNTVATLLALPAGLLSDRFGRESMYAVGLAGFAITYIGLGLVGQNQTLAFWLMAIYGVFPAFTDGVGKAWVSELAEPAQRGRAQGVFKMGQTLGVLTAGIWAGLLWNLGGGGGSLPLVIAGAGALVGGLSLLMARRQATN